MCCNIVRCGVGHVVCSNVMQNGVVWRERWCNVKYFGVM